MGLRILSIGFWSIWVTRPRSGTGTATEWSAHHGHRATIRRENLLRFFPLPWESSPKAVYCQAESTSATVGTTDELARSHDQSPVSRDRPGFLSSAVHPMRGGQAGLEKRSCLRWSGCCSHLLRSFCPPTLSYAECLDCYLYTWYYIGKINSRSGVGHNENSFCAYT